MVWRRPARKAPTVGSGPVQHVHVGGGGRCSVESLCAAEQ